MPVDYGQRLNAAELDDLVGYILREARTRSPLVIDNWKVMRGLMLRIESGAPK